MTPENKQRLRDAFQKALDRDPVAADKLFFLEGGSEPVTYRKVILNTLSGDAFFDGIDAAISRGTGTIDDYVQAIEKTDFSAALRGRKGFAP